MYKVLVDKINLKNGLEVLKGSIHSGDSFNNIKELEKGKYLEKINDRKHSTSRKK